LVEVGEGDVEAAGYQPVEQPVATDVRAVKNGDYEAYLVPAYALSLVDLEVI